MDRSVEEMMLEDSGPKAPTFKVNEDLFPGSRNAKLHVEKIHDYLHSCFPRYSEEGLYEVALTIWRLGKEF